MTVPLCSSLGAPDEDNAREESRKKSREFCQCPQVTYENDVRDDVAGTRKSNEPCNQLEGVHAPEFGAVLAFFPILHLNLTLSLFSFFLCLSCSETKAVAAAPASCAWSMSYTKV